MPRSRKSRMVKTLLQRHGTTYCDELGIDIARNTPAPLFRWLTASILFSSRISAENAAQAARALSKAGYRTAAKMGAATWQDRVDVLTAHGYKRFDESAARMLGDTAGIVLEKYGGDLRRLREAAGRDPVKERALLKEMKGLGDVGVDIFFREVQAAWDELFPFADRKALAAAQKLDLGEDAEALAGLVPGKDFPRLVAALVRCDLEKDYEAVAG
ncbi:hypothetical protein [Afifella sp. IM 167]|uniref:hypothetical protein n=1 Tax=Afifella sp. IM 167 TaxID=2033586 RepID=UPI001CCBC6B2|nr:hypothetical protein [Afifella sp. IM 167]MBZ8133548.1 hypothetical protein [Afifella sp. IM 167]